MLVRALGFKITLYVVAEFWSADEPAVTERQMTAIDMTASDL